MFQMGRELSEQFNQNWLNQNNKTLWEESPRSQYRRTVAETERLLSNISKVWFFS